MNITTKDHLTTLTPTQLAKAVGISRNDLNKILAQCGLQEKHSGGGWILSSNCQHGVQTRSKIKNDPSSEQAVQWQPDVLLESNVMERSD